jgi:hypothetical protein
LSEQQAASSGCVVFAIKCYQPPWQGQLTGYNSDTSFKLKPTFKVGYKALAKVLLPVIGLLGKPTRMVLQWYFNTPG